jgi:hypothetical protein
MTTTAHVRRIFVLPAIALCVVAVPALAGANNAVLEWNDIARQLIVVTAFTPIEQTRGMAIVHVAVHDAVNGITRQYQQYDPSVAPPAGASPEAAAIAAAHRALAGIVGDTDFLTNRYAASLVANNISPADPGIGFGEAIANALLAQRHDDGAAVAAYAYTAPGAGDVGVWTPVSSAATGQAQLPGWGNVAPWVLRSGSQFRPDPAPSLDSEQYAADYNEVLQFGASVGSVRTNEQTQIALFWRASPTALWNPILRTAIDSRQLDISNSARVAALFYLAAADASVACWDAKYFYNRWRPQAAIARGDEDGNAGTTGDPAWRPLLPTPPHPEFPSGHACNTGAMAFVLQDVFGDAPGYVIEATSPQNAGFVRYWPTFGEGVREVIDARVYSGIHVRTSDEVGARLGRQVARFVLTHALRPVRP